MLDDALERRRRLLRGGVGAVRVVDARVGGRLGEHGAPHERHHEARDGNGEERRCEVVANGPGGERAAAARDDAELVHGEDHGRDDERNHCKRSVSTCYSEHAQCIVSTSFGVLAYRWP